MNKCTRCGEVNPAEIHTCSPQTKAQRLADNLIKHLGGNTANEAAAELRRLDALNAELVGALEKLVDIYYDGGPLPVGEIDKVEAALAKAKEQT